MQNDIIKAIAVAIQNEFKHMIVDDFSVSSMLQLRIYGVKYSHWVCDVTYTGDFILVMNSNILMCVKFMIYDPSFLGELLDCLKATAIAVLDIHDDMWID